MRKEILILYGLLTCSVITLIGGILLSLSLNDASIFGGTGFGLIVAWIIYFMFAE